MGAPTEVAPYLRNTIVLKGDLGRRFEEYLADSALQPGMLAQLATDGGINPHATFGGFSTRMFVKEDALQGRTIYHAYATGDVVPVHHADVGELLNVLAPAGAAAIVEGDWLVSNGDGCLVKGTTESNSEVVYSNVAASAAITASSTETEFDKSYTFLANTLKAGDVIRIRAQGIATATHSTDTLGVKLYLGGLGGTALGNTGALDVANSDIFYIDCDLIIRTIGVSGTFVGRGAALIGPPASAVQVPFVIASTAIDTTVTNKISVAGKWSTTDVGNSCRLDQLFIEQERVGATGDLVAYAAEALDNSLGANQAFLAAYIL